MSVSATLRRLARELAIPFLVAVAAAIYVYVNGSEPEWIKKVSKFFATMFFVSWFVGQVVRVSKQLRIESDLQALRTDVGLVQGMLRKLEPPKEEDLKQANARPARTLVEEAEAAIAAGSTRAALIVMGAALEDALREFARSRGVAVGPAAPIFQVLEQLKSSIGEDFAARLRHLWSVRNSVMHHAGDAQTTASAPQLIASFKEAIESLNAAMVGTNYMPGAFSTLDGVEEELRRLGIGPREGPKYALPEVPTTDPLSVDTVTLTEQYARAQGWIGFAGETLGRVRAALLGLDNEMRYLEHSLTKDMKSERDWSHDSIQNALWTDASYLTLARAHQELAQKRMLLEMVLEDLRGRRDVLSRLFTVRGQEIELRRGEDRTGRNGRNGRAPGRSA